LRTQTNVRLAVLYGSLARGDEDAGSDLDLLLCCANDDLSKAGLVASLRSTTDRRIDLAYLSRVEGSAPLLLERILDEGRVLADRDEQWEALRARQAAIRARAWRAHRRQMISVADTIAELTA